ncbi:MAG: hypothetical protein AAFO94_07015 [Bacteroidota bacterium]
MKIFKTSAVTTLLLLSVYLVSGQNKMLRLSVGIQHPINDSWGAYHSLNLYRFNSFATNPFSTGTILELEYPILAFQRLEWFAAAGLINLRANQSFETRNVVKKFSRQTWNPFISTGAGWLLHHNTNSSLRLKGYTGIGLMALPTISTLSYGASQSVNAIGLTLREVRYTTQRENSNFPHISLNAGAALEWLYHLNDSIHFGFGLKYSAWWIAGQYQFKDYSSFPPREDNRVAYEFIHLPSLNFLIAYKL